MPSPQASDAMPPAIIKAQGCQFAAPKATRVQANATVLLVETQGGPMAEDYPRPLAAPPWHAEPWRQARWQRSQAALLFHIQRPAQTATTQTGETIGDEADALPTLKVFRPKPRRIPIHMGKKLPRPVSPQHVFHLLGATDGGLHIPLGGQARVDQVEFPGGMQ